MQIFAGGRLRLSFKLKETIGTCGFFDWNISRHGTQSNTCVGGPTIKRNVEVRVVAYSKQASISKINFSTKYQIVKRSLAKK